jgi:hypothetical protein
MGACNPSLVWLKDLPDLVTAWHTCERAHWLIWLLARTAPVFGSAEHRKVCWMLGTLAERNRTEMNTISIESLDKIVRYGHGVQVSHSEFVVIATDTLLAWRAYGDDRVASYAANASVAMAVCYASKSSADSAGSSVWSVATSEAIASGLQDPIHGLRTTLLEAYAHMVRVVFPEPPSLS